MIMLMTYKFKVPSCSFFESRLVGKRGYRGVCSLLNFIIIT